MFDPSAPHIIILLIVVLLLFGSRRLPGAAKSLGKSMHLFKRAVSGSYQDEDEDGTPADPATATQVSALPPAQQPAAPGRQDDSRQRIADLERQLQEIKDRQF